MFRATNSPIFRSTLTVYTVLVQCTDIAADRYISFIYSQKCSWRWPSLSPETCWADSNRSIKRSINENCCILLLSYIVVLTMHGLTKSKKKVQRREYKQYGRLQAVVLELDVLFVCSHQPARLTMVDTLHIVYAALKNRQSVRVAIVCCHPIGCMSKCENRAVEGAPSCLRRDKILFC